MENHDQRRRQGGDDRSRRYPPPNEERGRDRESWRPSDEHERRSAAGEETGWLDYDPNPGRSEQRYGERGGRDEPRHGQRGSERPSFSPDWSREGAEPRYSDDPYYSRNRDRDYSRGGSDDYNSPDWPYEHGSRGRDQRSGEGRDVQRAREDEQGSHYRGYYSRSAQPFAYPGGQGYVYSESITLHGPYTGRGPKGYKRSDQQIIEEASQRLERDGHIDATEIEVTAQDGVLTLRGSVPDRRTKRRAEECVESVYGARDVMNELRLSSQTTDVSRGAWSSGSPGSQAEEEQRAQSARGSQTAQPSARTSGGSPSEQSGESKKPPKH
jgi:hypothetical protein